METPATSAAVDEYGDDVLENVSDEQAQALLAEFPELRNVDRAKLEAALKRVHTLSKGGRRGTVRKLRPRSRQAMSIFNIVKLADLMDKHDKEIADVLDQLIEQDVYLSADGKKWFDFWAGGERIEKKSV